MKHKVSELEGALLDAAVAKAEGMQHAEWGSGAFVPIVRRDGMLWIDEWCDGSSLKPYTPSSQWHLGGPIIERERIEVGPARWDTDWYGATTMHNASGPTPLIAAMRAYVASKLGEEVELP